MDRKGKVLLTNEAIRGKFPSSFELVNYAIELAVNMIHTGRESRVKSEVQNRALVILEEIHAGKDHFDDIIAIAPALSSPVALDAALAHTLVMEEPAEKQKRRLKEIFDEEE